MYSNVYLNVPPHAESSSSNTVLQTNRCALMNRIPKPGAQERREGERAIHREVPFVVVNLLQLVKNGDSISEDSGVPRTGVGLMKVSRNIHDVVMSYT